MVANQKAPLWFILIFVAIGAGISLFAARNLDKNKAKHKAYIETKATLFKRDHVQSPNMYGHRTVTGYTLYYKYEIDDKTYVLRDTIKIHYKKTIKIKDERTIKYDPDNPYKAFFDGIDSNWLILLFGLAWTTISTFGFFEKHKPYLR